MKRAFIMVLDSFGIGATEDAAKFGDVGSDTFGHIAEACAKGEADKGRKGPLHLPNLTRLGLVSMQSPYIRNDIQGDRITAGFLGRF